MRWKCRLRSRGRGNRCRIGTRRRSRRRPDIRLRSGSRCCFCTYRDTPGQRRALRAAGSRSRHLARTPRRRCSAHALHRCACPVCRPRLSNAVPRIARAPVRRRGPTPERTGSGTRGQSARRAFAAMAAPPKKRSTSVACPRQFRDARITRGPQWRTLNSAQSSAAYLPTDEQPPIYSSTWKHRRPVDRFVRQQPHIA
jgi:hypothetical protein